MKRYARHAAYAAIALVFLWTLAWMAVAQRAVRQAEAWRAAQDISLDWESIDVKGWPFAWRATVERPRAAGTGWTWSGERLTAEIAPWRPREIGLGLPGEQRATLAGTAFVARAARPGAVLTLDPSGRFARLDLDFEAVEIAQDGAPPSRIRKLDASLAIPATDRLDAALRLRGVRASESVPRLPGTSSDFARAELSVQLRGPRPGGTLGAAARAWRDAGGTLEIVDLLLDWGELRLSGEGTLALDDRDRPLGAGTVRLTGWNEVVDALQAARYIEPMPAAVIKGALNMLARAAGGEPGAVRVPVAAQDGRLVVYRIPVASLPSLRLE
jgi:hypothetical protein